MCICLLAALSLAAVELIELHGPDGQVLWMNTAEISALRQPTKADINRYFAKGTHCIVTATNGKIIAAVETCSAIRDKLTER